MGYIIKYMSDENNTNNSGSCDPIPTSGFTSMLSDNTGGTSTTRVTMLIWAIGVFTIWGAATIISVVHGNFVLLPIPESVITVLLGVTGLKVVQRFGEK
jgi:hypothetical protein